MKILFSLIAAVVFMRAQAQTKGTGSIPDISRAVLEDCTLDKLMAGNDQKEAHKRILARQKYRLVAKSLKSMKAPEEPSAEEVAEANLIQNEMKTKMNTCISEICGKMNCSDFPPGKFGPMMNSLKAALLKHNAQNLALCKSVTGDASQCYENQVSANLAAMVAIDLSDDLSKLANVYYDNSKVGKPVKMAAGMFQETAGKLAEENTELNRKLGEAALGGATGAK